jgi:hypothetical protein
VREQQVVHEGSDDRLRLAAVRALEVGVLDEGDRRVVGATDVVVGAVRLIEVDDRLDGVGAQSGAQPAGQTSERPERDQAQGDRDERGREDADLRFLELLAVEGDLGDEEGDGEADARDGRHPDQ